MTDCSYSTIYVCTLLVELMTREMGKVSRTCQCSDKTVLQLPVQNVVHSERNCTTLPVAAKYKSSIIALSVLITIAQ